MIKNQETTQKSTPSICLCLSKKPRASKTSKRHTIGGLNFFFKMSKAETGNNIKIYYDDKPYPYIMVIRGSYHWSTGWSSFEELTEEAKSWCINNHSKIISRLKMLDTYIKIDEEMWRTNESKK